MHKESKVLIPYGTTAFCEDIRFEASGSVSLVGVYNKDIVVPEFPIIIPKFGVYCVVVLPKRPEDRIPFLKFQVFLPGDGDRPSIYHESVAEDTNFAPKDFEPDPDVPLHSKVIQQMVVSPLQLNKEGYIRVRTYVDDAYVRAGAIRVMKNRNVGGEA
ncbi:hypothetical protein [Methylorubrum extorquens]|uniref:hypothetical protein n=1 Tax=Methylorubrum extorquens TaxID=408 RepID=UPI0020A03E1E|nr:hypothetical protein [Methylorubrum extorquens]MCP1537784.1 hypothetical protein [Methylorubrum extorquens]